MHLTRLLAVERRWLFFGLAALSILMSAIDATIVAVALPTLVADLNTSLVLAGWTLTAYTLTQTVMLPLAGKLAEQFGQMRVFLACIFLFTLGSLLCGLAPNVYALVACRVVQAIGGGGFFPAATGLVAQQFPETRSRMIGLFASIFPIGGILGPNLGGAVIEHVGWRAIFLINVPLGILVVAMLAQQALAERPAPLASAARSGTTRPAARAAGRQRLDVLGTVLFALTVVGLLTALSLLGEDLALIGTGLFWTLVLGSGATLTAFVWQERRAANPILDLSLVARHPFAVVNAYNILTGACFMGFFSFIPYYATVQFGMGPMEAGAILTPRSLVMIAVSTSVSFLLHRLGYRLPMLAGMACVSAALLLLGLGIGGLRIGPVEVGPVLSLLGMMALSGMGMGMLIPASNNAGLDLLPQRAAVISGIRGLFNSTGGVIGTAIIVVWLELSPDKAAGLRSVFTVLGLLMMVTTPLVFLIPERESDAERRRRLAAEGTPARAAAAGTERLVASPAGHPDG